MIAVLSILRKQEVILLQLLMQKKTETFVVTVKENSPEIPDPVPSPKPEPNPDSNTKPKQNENKVVKTGDEQNPLLSISIFALASVVITGSFIRRKKYNL